MTKVLIVDDSIVVRSLIKEWLVESGYEVVGEAENGEQGVAKFKELNPDITTLDITMPGMHGVDALKEIMAYKPDANVLMVSAEGKRDGNIPQTLLIGACEFIEKPLSKVMFMKTIEHIVARISGEGCSNAGSEDA